MMTIDRIVAARRLASQGDTDGAERELLLLQNDLFTDAEKDAWIRAWRSVAEHKNPNFYGRHNAA